jgi:Mrp family chromosome partitioning ATPase/capsular polysaccharide biosynthesis protein
VLCVTAGFFGGKRVESALPPTYQAVAIVHLDAQARTGSNGVPVVQSVAAYATMATADSIISAVQVHYPDLNRQALSREIVTTPDLNGQNILFIVTLPHAREAANLANDLARLFVIQQNAVIKQGYEKQIRLLNDTIAAEQTQIDEFNQKIVQTSATNAIVIQQYQDQRNQIQSLQNQNVATRDNLLTQQVLYSAPLAVIQTATPPRKPSTVLGTLPFVPVTMLLLLILGSVLIFCLERGSNRINSVQALQKAVALPVFGTLRWCVPAPHEIPLQAFSELKHPYIEECRVMMADILFQAEKAQARVLAITALKPRAGTSTVAAQLATLLALSKRRVLLIDANLHQPSLHERLDAPNGAGLAHLLEEACRMKGTIFSSGAVSVIDRLAIDNFIIPTILPNLFLLPAGTPSTNPANLLSMSEMEQFLKWAATRTDYVVIDCPALAISEAHVLGVLSDQTFVVIDATRDRLKQVVAMKDELAGGSVGLAGLIVNKLNRWI